MKRGWHSLNKKTPKNVCLNNSVCWCLSQRSQAEAICCADVSAPIVQAVATSSSIEYVKWQLLPCQRLVV